MAQWRAWLLEGVGSRVQSRARASRGFDYSIYWGNHQKPSFLTLYRLSPNYRKRLLWRVPYTFHTIVHAMCCLLIQKSSPSICLSHPWTWGGGAIPFFKKLLHFTARVVSYSTSGSISSADVRSASFSSLIAAPPAGAVLESSLMESDVQCGLRCMEHAACGVFQTRCHCPSKCKQRRCTLLRNWNTNRDSLGNWSVCIWNFIYWQWRMWVNLGSTTDTPKSLVSFSH